MKGATGLPLSIYCAGLLSDPAKKASFKLGVVVVSLFAVIILLVSKG